ncbi:S-layer homology domain-containing protein [Texcoconibacillus texcoconensis]|uniref:SLH domain-containing protein n=1 Tax=Texcoconibacillus texcoconensis TaxID=1095777 RepID=A0A840QUV1_9BACI|nr:S-layer homology domain-containing protein [Texcoconibacillus texcoconensis]MBB5175051.1 hypothetical protein [Texcoconibacillus texcoconensis]
MYQPKSYRKFLAATASAVAVVATAGAVQAEGTQEQESSFTDVSEDHAERAAIEAMVERGIIEGYANGTFKPDETISREHIAVMLNRYLQHTMRKNCLLTSMMSMPIILMLQILQRLLILKFSKGPVKGFNQMN